MYATMMDDDPDDLAAVFFAQQAQKEKAKVTLPTEDWIRVIEAKQQHTSTAGSEAVIANDKNTIGQSSCLVTIMPPAPTYLDVNGEDGVVGIILAPSISLGDNTCIIEGTQTHGDSGRGILTDAETKMRRNIKDSLVHKLENTMKKV